jgi:transcriptional regulator with XRE-family HTH domain
MINNTTTVGQRIKAAREKAGITQSELAVLLGYTSPTAISLIEADERSVKVDTLEKIAEVLHQDVQYLTTGNNSQISTVKTALRADPTFDKDDVAKIENFIDFLASQKDKDNGRGTQKD